MSEPSPEYGPDFWVKACGGQAAQARQALHAHVQSAGELSRPPKGLWVTFQHVTRQARMVREMQV